ncbi:MAG: divergent PAP2 family protein [Candidatus Omnitrophica bacterium]|nr:divergent PAP2 family protein [Candidatus Omnitrophota bacterium]
MSDFWSEIFKNKVIWVSFLSWVIAQGAKIVRGVIKEKRFNFSWLLGTGGMPSSHSSAVTALAVCLGAELGFSSPFFALACIFALVTMFDAQTWRRSIGVQAKILNRIMDDIQEGRAIEDTKLKELVGHTPVEVFVGALIGVIIPMMFYR